MLSTERLENLIKDPSMASREETRELANEALVNRAVLALRNQQNRKLKRQVNVTVDFTKWQLHKLKIRLKQWQISAYLILAATLIYGWLQS